MSGSEELLATRDDAPVNEQLNEQAADDELTELDLAYYQFWYEFYHDMHPSWMNSLPELAQIGLANRGLSDYSLLCRSLQVSTDIAPIDAPFDLLRAIRIKQKAQEYVWLLSLYLFPEGYDELSQQGPNPPVLTIVQKYHQALSLNKRRQQISDFPDDIQQSATNCFVLCLQDYALAAIQRITIVLDQQTAQQAISFWRTRYQERATESEQLKRNFSHLFALVHKHIQPQES